MTLNQLRKPSTAHNYRTRNPSTVDPNLLFLSDHGNTDESDGGVETDKDGGEKGKKKKEKSKKDKLTLNDGRINLGFNEKDEEEEAPKEKRRTESETRLIHKFSLRLKAYPYKKFSFSKTFLISKP